LRRWEPSRRSCQQHAFTVHRASIARAGEEVVLDRRGRRTIRVRCDLCVHREREPRVGVTETVLGGSDVDA
jgi:hypothetical protein